MERNLSTGRNQNQTIKKINTQGLQREIKEDPKTIKQCTLAVLKNIQCYLKNSTLHGLKYVGNNSLPWTLRIFWLACIISAPISSVYFVHNVYEKYTRNPLIATVNSDPTPIADIPFPAVTICNTVSVKKSEAEVILSSGTRIEKLMLEDACNFDPSVQSNQDKHYNNSWENLYNFMLRVHQPCEEMLKVCRWRSKEFDCAHLFRTVLTDEGFCCSFNQLPMDRILKHARSIDQPYLPQNYQVDDWNPDRGYSANAPYSVFPFRSPGPGERLGLSVVLDADVDNYYCSTIGGTGFKILIHNPAEIQSVTDYAFLLPPGVESGVVFSPIIKDCTKEVKSINIKKRHCYFKDEKHLAYYKSYTTANCKMECLSNRTLDECGCVPYFLPRDESAKVCGQLRDECIVNVEVKKLSNKISRTENKHCKCYPGCSELSFEKRMSYAKLSGSFQRKPNIIKNTSLEYFKNNMAIVHVYFVGSQFSKFTTSVLYESADFISTVGGLLAIFLGFSFLSVVEMLYFFTLRILCIGIRSKRQQHNNNVS